MAGYKKGQITKDIIISSAKKLFYIHGFKNVSLNQICKEANCKLGTLTYYFKKKDDLIRYLYNDYMDRVESYIIENSGSMDSAEAYIHMIMFYYFNIYRDAGTRNFHFEILNQSSMNPIFNDSKALIMPIIEHSSLSLDDEKIELMVIADNAVRRELNLLSMKEPPQDVHTIKDLVSRICIVTQLFSFDQTQLNLYLKHSYEFLINHLNSSISLL